MPAKPITIGDLHFAKKADAASFLGAMLRRYDVGDRVNSADEEVLRAALALHPNAETKMGSGVATFSVRSADFGTKCFWLNRIDGTTEKFSYRTCIYG
jgi:hypothetical protein